MSILIVVALAAAFYALAGIRIAQEYERGVIFRLGRFSGIKGPGLYWIAPIFDRQWKLDLRTRTVTVEQQETITRDSVTIKVNAVLWYRISDPGQAIVQVQNYQAAVYQLALTSLRNIIGQHQLDEVLKERDKINGLLKSSLNEVSSPWGVTVSSV